MGDSYPGVPLSQLTEIVIGRQLSPSKRLGERPRPYLRAANVSPGAISLEDVLEMDFTEAEETRFRLLPGDTLMVEGGNEKSVGATALVTDREEGLCFQNTLIRFRSTDPVALDPHFLRLALDAMFRRGDFARLATGTTIMHIGARRVGGVEIPVPPVHQQRRIADLIDAADASARRAESLSRAATDAYSALLRSPTVDSWPTSPLPDVLEVARAGGTPNRKDASYFGGEVPWLKSGEVDNPEILTTEEAITEAGLASSAAWVVPEDTVVVAMYGATAGMVGYLRAPMATNQAVLALRPRSEVMLPRFLFHMLRSRSARMKERATGAAQPNLSKQRVLEEQVPLPSVEIQTEFSALLDDLLAVATEAFDCASALAASRSTLLADLLSGDHQIPDSYDALLESV